MLSYQNVFDLYTQLQSVGGPVLAVAIQAVTTTEGVIKLYDKLTSIFTKTDEEEIKADCKTLLDDLKVSELTELESYLQELVKQVPTQTNNINQSSNGNQSPNINNVTGGVNIQF
ncbi:MAG: hypothetical protein ACRCXZ_07960 [Patescibacteria group bacterium]